MSFGGSVCVGVCVGKTEMESVWSWLSGCLAAKFNGAVEARQKADVALCSLRLDLSDPRGRLSSSTLDLD
jgi:hypothetical protein